MVELTLPRKQPSPQCKSALPVRAFGGDGIGASARRLTQASWNLVGGPPPRPCRGARSGFLHRPSEREDHQ